VTQGPERDAVWSARFPVEGGGAGLVTSPDVAVDQLAASLGMVAHERVDCEGVRLWWLSGTSCDGLPKFVERLTPLAGVRASFCVEPLDFDELLLACGEKRIDLAACKRSLARLDRECAAQASSSCTKRRERLSAVIGTGGSDEHPVSENCLLCAARWVDEVRRAKFVYQTWKRTPGASEGE
jgi:hypothetical protein